MKAGKKFPAFFVTLHSVFRISIKFKTCIMKKFLKEGDVIYLENGMKVYGNIPEKFVYSNKKKSNAVTHHEAVIGKVLTNDTDITEDVEGLVKDIRHAFDFRLGIQITKVEAKEMIGKKVNMPKASTFCLQGGEFLVVKSSLEGGGTGMGPHDIYPDGHHVTCKRLNIDGTYNEDGEEISFYQSGSFTSMITKDEIQPIRTLSKKFS